MAKACSYTHYYGVHTIAKEAGNEDVELSLSMSELIARLLRVLR